MVPILRQYILKNISWEIMSWFTKFTHIFFLSSATCRIIVFTNSCVNVFVYSLRLQNFRKYMMKDLRHCCENFRKCLQTKRKGFQIHSSQCEETSTSYSNPMFSSHTKEEDISIVNIWDLEREREREREREIHYIVAFFNIIVLQ